MPYQDKNSDFEREEDIESTGYLKRRKIESSYQVDIDESGLLIPADTPFFHVDLQSAVRAAEAAVIAAQRSLGLDVQAKS